MAPQSPVRRLRWGLALVLAIPVLQGAGIEVQSQRPPERRMPDPVELRPEPTDAAQKAIRDARGRRFDMRGGSPVTELPTDVQTLVAITHPPPLPALPVAESSLVLIGQVEEVQPYLSSPSKTRVYTEYGVHIEIVFKNMPASPVVEGSKIIADRLGGVVRLPSGRVITATVRRRNLPLLGHRYVFFLKENVELGSFTILSAYEIVEGVVFPLDEEAGSDRPQPYFGADSESLIADLKKAINP